MLAEIKVTVSSIDVEWTLRTSFELYPTDVSYQNTNLVLALLLFNFPNEDNRKGDMRS